MLTPQRRIQTDQDLAHWLASKGCTHYLGWISLLSHKIVAKPLDTSPHPPTPIIGKLESFLSRLKQIIPLHPPLQSSQRYGNAAFRTYIAQVSSELPSLLESLLPPPSADRPDLLAQILPLLLETSFLGNPTRIDYGTGHELAFFLFLYALRVAEVLGEEDDEGVVLRVFDRYLDLVWELQDTYKLEPAGSHGVWGLDDYCFLPYLFGSSQLLHSSLLPSSLIPFQSSATSTKLRSIDTPSASLSSSTPPPLPTNLIMENGGMSFYEKAIGRVGKLKKGAWFEHSPMLHTLSHSVTQGWPKIHSGLVKMYEGEVLGKRVVVQHLMVGGLIEW